MSQDETEDVHHHLGQYSQFFSELTLPTSGTVALGISPAVESESECDLEEFPTGHNSVRPGSARVFSTRPRSNKARQERHGVRKLYRRKPPPPPVGKRIAGVHMTKGQKFRDDAVKLNIDAEIRRRKRDAMFVGSKVPPTHPFEPLILSKPFKSQHRGIKCFVYEGSLRRDEAVGDKADEMSKACVFDRKSREKEAAQQRALSARLAVPKVWPTTCNERTTKVEQTTLRRQSYITLTPTRQTRSCTVTGKEQNRTEQPISASESLIINGLNPQPLPNDRNEPSLHHKELKPRPLIKQSRNVIIAVNRGPQPLPNDRNEPSLHHKELKPRPLIKQCRDVITAVNRCLYPIKIRREKTHRSRYDEKHPLAFKCSPTKLQHSVPVALSGIDEVGEPQEMSEVDEIKPVPFPGLNRMTHLDTTSIPKDGLTESLGPTMSVSPVTVKAKDKGLVTSPTKTEPGPQLTARLGVTLPTDSAKPHTEMFIKESLITPSSPPIVPESKLEDSVAGPESKLEDTVAGPESKLEDTVAGPESKLEDTVAGPESKLEDTVAGPESKLEDTVVGPESKLEDTVAGPESKLEDNVSPSHETGSAINCSTAGPCEMLPETEVNSSQVDKSMGSDPNAAPAISNAFMTEPPEKHVPRSAVLIAIATQLGLLECQRLTDRSSSFSKSHFGAATRSDTENYPEAITPMPPSAYSEARTLPRNRGLQSRSSKPRPSSAKVSGWYKESKNATTQSKIEPANVRGSYKESKNATTQSNIEPVLVRERNPPMKPVVTSPPVSKSRPVRPKSAQLMQRLRSHVELEVAKNSTIARPHSHIDVNASQQRSTRKPHTKATRPSSARVELHRDWLLDVQIHNEHASGRVPPKQAWLKPTTNGMTPKPPLAKCNNHNNRPVSARAKFKSEPNLDQNLKTSCRAQANINMVGPTSKQAKQRPTSAQSRVRQVDSSTRCLKPLQARSTKAWASGHFIEPRQPIIPRRPIEPKCLPVTYRRPLSGHF